MGNLLPNADAIYKHAKNLYFLRGVFPYKAEKSIQSFSFEYFAFCYDEIVGSKTGMTQDPACRGSELQE